MMYGVMVYRCMKPHDTMMWPLVVSHCTMTTWTRQARLSILNEHFIDPYQTQMTLSLLKPVG